MASENLVPQELYSVGDHVLVGGCKKGVIGYIGETQFAAGVWAGVILDSPVGKNDGSVAGTRYFTCMPLHGVFSKLTKLSRQVTSLSDQSSSEVSVDNRHPRSEIVDGGSVSEDLLDNAALEYKLGSILPNSASESVSHENDAVVISSLKDTSSTAESLLKVSSNEKVGVTES